MPTNQKSPFCMIFKRDMVKVNHFYYPMIIVERRCKKSLNCWCRSIKCVYIHTHNQSA